jgi:hypothetical protein
MIPRNLSQEELKAMIAEEAADIDERRARAEEEGPLYRAARREQRSYHIRMPEDRLEQLRRLAEEAGLPTSTLMRQWLLERSEGELASEVPPDPRVQRAVRLELERAGLIPRAS